MSKIKWKTPHHIKFVKCGDYVRLEYSIKGFKITTQGFKNKKEFLKVLRGDVHFEVKKSEHSEEKQ